MTHAEKIKQSAQKTTKLRASYISYTRNFNVGKIELLRTIWIDDKHKKEVFSFSVLLLQRIFKEIQQKEGGKDTFTASKG
jgi:hypothetical protein